MLKHILTSVAIISIIGCSARPIRTVEYTSDNYVIGARTKNVEVHAKHTFPFEKQKDVWVDVWTLRLVNNDKDRAWCAGIDWRHMDYTINVPSIWFYLPANSYSDIGSAVQQSWTLTEAVMTFDDAAFSVYKLHLMKPLNGQCVVKPN
jgi:hypothetical protein